MSEKKGKKILAKNKKIIFVSPPVSKEELYKNLADAGSDLPPVGLATLAAVTREKGYITKILDAQTPIITYEEAAKQILDENPDYIGMTAVTISIFNAAELAKLIKQKNKKVKIILGGPHITAEPIETMKRFPQFDVGVYGEGEDTIIDLLNALDHKKSLAKVRGLILRDPKNKNKIFLTQTRPPIIDLDKLPLPAWDLLPDLVKCYHPPADSLYRWPSTLMITSRGCTGQCVFCDNNTFGTRLRGFSADYMIKMIRKLQADYGIKDLFIEDDNFLVFKRRLSEFCNKIIDEKIDITWSCLGRVDNVEPEMLALMKKAGCWQISFGCESGSQRVLDLMNKKTKIENIERAIKMTRDAGIHVKGLFMMGSFGEDRQSIEDTIKFIKRLPMTDFHITCFTPLPGAEAWRTAPKYGWFDPNWKQVNMSSVTNFVPFGLTKEEIEKHYRRAWMAFYFKPRVIFGYAIKLRQKRFRKKIIKGGLSFLKFLIKKPV